MKTTEIKLLELFEKKFETETAKELVGEIKSMTQDDLAERIESRIIGKLTWRLLFFFIAQISFTMGLLKLLGVV